MKSALRLTPCACAAVAVLFLAGCLFKTPTVPVRYFVLAPISTNDAPASGESISVGLGFVKMPPYLLRDSLAVRNGANEIEYLEGALWGERLDQCFQQAVAANLSRLLPSDNVYVTDWARTQVVLRVFISVQQFDVDTNGRGTLIAQWRVNPPDGDTPLKSAIARLERTGPPPRGNAGTVAATLSELTAEFSRDLAQSIRDTVKKGKN